MSGGTQSQGIPTRMQHFEPWHVERIALTIKQYKDELGSEYTNLVEDFIDLFTVENPRFKAAGFRRRCGVPAPFGLRAKVPVKKTRKGVSKYG